MLRLLLVVVVVATCSCGGGSSDEPSPDNHGFGWQYDVQGASGLRLRYSPTYDALDPKADVAPYESDWAAVQACVGVSAPAPFVVLVPFPYAGFPPGTAGLYLRNPPLFVIYGRSDRLDFRHEAVHYLLEVSTGDADAAHRSPLFVRCAG